MKNVLKAWQTRRLRDSKNQWIVLYKRGEYEYRNPDSVYVHAYNTFPTREKAEEYLDQHIAKIDRPGWVLYQEMNL